MTLSPAVSTGDAWVSRVGDRVYINNSHENPDIAQDIRLALPGDLGTFSGTVLPHSSVIVNRTGNQLRLLADVDRKGPCTDDRITRLQLTASSQPIVTSTSTEVGVSRDQATGTLGLQLGHDAGAVERVLEF